MSRFEKLQTEEFPQIARMWSWSSNYEGSSSPACMFLDLIGYSMEQLGEPLFNFETSSLGYLELDQIQCALAEYVTRPEDANNFVQKLIHAENNDDHCLTCDARFATDCDNVDDACTECCGCTEHKEDN